MIVPAEKPQTRPERLGLSQEDVKQIYREVCPLYRRLEGLAALDAYLGSVERGLGELEAFLARQPDRPCPNDEED